MLGYQLRKDKKKNWKREESRIESVVSLAREINYLETAGTAESIFDTQFRCRLFRLFRLFFKLKTENWKVKSMVCFA